MLYFGKIPSEDCENAQDQPAAVSKIEKQTDMYLSTLRSYVEAMGGELDVVVRLPNRAPVRVKSLEDVTSS